MNKEKYTRMVLRDRLIHKIWNYCKHTHGEEDYRDLWSFSINELTEILDNLKEVNDE